MNFKTLWYAIFIVGVCVIIAVVIDAGFKALKQAGYDHRVDTCMQTERFSQKDCEFIAGGLYDAMNK